MVEDFFCTSCKAELLAGAQSDLGTNAPCCNVLMSQILSVHVQARGVAISQWLYTGMPVPPEGQFDLVFSPEAEEQWKAGQGGPLAATSMPLNGVYGPPIGMFSLGTMIGWANIVRSGYRFCAVLWHR